MKTLLTFIFLLLIQVPSYAQLTVGSWTRVDSTNILDESVSGADIKNGTILNADLSRIDTVKCPQAN